MGLGWAVCGVGLDPFLLFLDFSHPASAAEGQTSQHPSLSFSSYVETIEGTLSAPQKPGAGNYVYGYYCIVAARPLCLGHPPLQGFLGCVNVHCTSLVGKLGKNVCELG